MSKKKEIIVLDSRSIKSVEKLTNAELKVQMNIFYNPLISGKNIVWIRAIAVAKIISRNLYVEDFETITNFAKYISVTQGRVSQMVKAVKFMRDKKMFPQTVNDDGTVTIKYDEIRYTLDNAYCLSTLSEESYNALLDEAKKSNIIIEDLPQKELKKLVKQFKQLS